MKIQTIFVFIILSFLIMPSFNAISVDFVEDNDAPFTIVVDESPHELIFSVPSGEEIITKRTPHSRHYMQDDGTILAVLTIAPYFEEYEEVDEISSSNSGYVLNKQPSTNLTYYDSNYYGFTYEVNNDGLHPLTYVFSSNEAGSYLNGVGWDYHWINDRTFRSFAQWDTSSIPNYASILGVSTQYYVTSVTTDPFGGDVFDYSEVWLDIYEMTNRPSEFYVSSGGEPDGRWATLHNDAKSGVRYHTSSNWVVAGSGDSATIDLGPSAPSRLQSLLVDNWFALGYVDYYETQWDEGINLGGKFAVLMVNYELSSLPVTIIDTSATTANVLETISFIASNSYSPTGYIEYYRWDFGDGSNTGYLTTFGGTTFIDVYHKFWGSPSYPYIYTVTLTVWDDLGYSNSAQTNIQIDNPYGNSGLTQSDWNAILPLINEYSPVLMVDPNANHNCPGPVSDFIDNSRLIDNINYALITDFPIVQDLMAFSGSGYYLDLTNHNDKGDNYHTYVHCRKDNGLVFIQYWFSYYYNDGINNHEGDWEMMQISLDPSNNYQPINVVLSQHTDNFNFGEKRAWKNVEKYRGGGMMSLHPVIYVSSGTGIHANANSHANYFYLGDGPSTDYTDNCIYALTNPTIVILPNIEDDLFTSGHGWLSFGGKWGDGLDWTTGSPPGPAFVYHNTAQTKFRWFEPYDFEIGRLWDGNFNNPWFSPLWSEANLKPHTNLTVPDKVIFENEIVQLEATLSWDIYVLSGANLKFYVDKQYVGYGVTDASGKAYFNYSVSGLSLGEHSIDVVFEEIFKDWGWCNDVGILTVEKPHLDIPLNIGWNLVSIPLIQPDTYIPTVLNSIAGKWSVLKYYDGVTKIWKSHRVGSTVNTIFNIDHTMSFWLYVDQACVLDVQGTLPAYTEITLYSGWNLVGYPSFKAKLASEALVGTGADIVSIYQSTTPYIQDRFDLSSVTMESGKGYWVHVTADTVWTVDW